MWKIGNCHRNTWSSARAYLTGQPDGITTLAPALDRVGDFAAFLGAAHDSNAFEPLRRAEITGRPIGAPDFWMRWRKGSGER